MTRPVLAAVAALALALLVGSPLRADEKPVKESDVPKPAIDAVKKKYPGATLKGFSREEEGGKVTYEVEVEVKGKDAKGAAKTRAIDIDVSAEGKILAEEETISKDELPDAVKKALGASKYGSWEVKKVEKIVTEENEADPSFEVIVVTEGKKAEVVFDKSGKITKEEEKKAKPKKEEGKGEEDEKD